MIVITNGQRYICYGKNRCVNHTDDLEQAEYFDSVDKAVELMKEAPRVTRYDFVFDTDTSIIIWRWDKDSFDKAIEERHKEHENEVIAVATKHKRITFTQSQRAEIYRKTKGHCYLCNQFVDYNDFEVEHKIPLALGGTNNIDNVFCSCHDCNSMKSSLEPKDLMQRMKLILLYQAEQKSRRGKKSFRYRLTSRLITFCIG